MESNELRQNLWRNFSENDNQQCRAQNSNQAGCQAVQQNRKCRIHQDVAQQNAAQQKVPVISNRLNGASMFLFYFRASIAQNLLNKMPFICYHTLTLFPAYLEIRSIE